MDLGLTAAEFWERTPRQIQVLMRRATEKEWRLARRIGALELHYLNAHRDTEKQPVPLCLDDIVPWLSWIPKPEPERKRATMTVEEQIEQARFITEAIRAVNKTNGR